MVKNYLNLRIIVDFNVDFLSLLSFGNILFFAFAMDKSVCVECFIFEDIPVSLCHFFV